MNLHETLRSTMLEYARLFAQIIQCSHYDWCCGAYEVCCFDQQYLFMARDIIAVVDNMDRLTAKYGSRETVGQHIMAEYSKLRDSETYKSHLAFALVETEWNEQPSDKD